MIETEANRTITISGEVQGDVEIAPGFTARITDGASVHGNVLVAEGASLRIEGEVQGDVTSLGSLHVADDAAVLGTITSKKPVV